MTIQASIANNNAESHGVLLNRWSITAVSAFWLIIEAYDPKAVLVTETERLSYAIVKINGDP